MFKKILNTLNIRADGKQKYILITAAITELMMTYAHPMLLKTIVTALPAEWLAFESVALSVSTLVIGALWQGKLREGAIRRFRLLAIAQSLCGFLLGMYLCFVSFNVWVLAIASLIYTTLITIFLTKCIIYFKSRLWSDKGREVYDNNESIVDGIVCIVGYLFAIIAMPPLRVSVFLWSMCCLIHYAGWIRVVGQANKKETEDR